MFIPGYFEPDVVPVEPGKYELTVDFTWGKETITSPPAELQISPASESDRALVAAIDVHLVRYLEQNRNPWPPCPPSAEAVLRQGGDSRLATAIQVQQLSDRWRRLRYAREQTPDELRKASEELRLDLETALDRPRLGSFGAELLYTLAAVNVFEFPLIQTGSQLERAAMDAQTRAAWQQVRDRAAKAVRRLQQDYPESSFNQDARDLLKHETAALRRTLEKHPDALDAEEFRATLGVFERLTGERKE